MNNQARYRPTPSTEPHIGALTNELAKVIRTADWAAYILQRTGFPVQNLPPFNFPITFWNQVVLDVQNGMIEGGIAKLIEVVREAYPANPVFQTIGFASSTSQENTYRASSGSSAAHRILAESIEGEYFESYMELLFGVRCTRKYATHILAKAEYAKAHPPHAERKKKTTLRAGVNKRLVRIGPVSDSARQEGKPPLMTPCAIDLHDTGQEHTIGRDERCDIQLNENGISSLHAILHNGQIYDCMSRNGTWVNGLKIAQCQLHNGDIVRFCGHAYRYFDLQSPRRTQHAEGKLALCIEALRPLERVLGSHEECDVLRHFIVRAIASSLVGRYTLASPSREAMVIYFDSEQDCIDHFRLITEACNYYTGGAISMEIYGGVAQANVERALQNLDSARKSMHPERIVITR